MNFVVWSTSVEPGICDLNEVENVEDDFELTGGTSRIDGWPKDAFCRMSGDRKKDVGLADVLFCTVRVISQKLKDALVAAEAGNIEYLPITIKNHKGRVASKDYFICNPQDFVDCVDVAKSKVKFNAIDPDLMDTCKSLVLREQEIPPRLQVFRLHRWGHVILMRRALADRLVQAGFTGLVFQECSQFLG